MTDEEKKAARLMFTDGEFGPNDTLNLRAGGIPLGTKHDKGKNRWELMKPFWPYLDEIVKVLTLGAIEYSDNNWMEVGIERYEGALMRHISAYMQGERVDTKSGVATMAHVICNLLFLRWFDEHGEKSNAQIHAASERTTDCSTSDDNDRGKSVPPRDS